MARRCIGLEESRYGRIDTPRCLVQREINTSTCGIVEFAFGSRLSFDGGELFKHNMVIIVGGPGILGITAERDRELKRTFYSEKEIMSSCNK
jgi:hypothetical protein